MLCNQDKVHDKLTDFAVRVTDQSFTVLLCEGKFTALFVSNQTNRLLIAHISDWLEREYNSVLSNYHWSD